MSVEASLTEEERYQLAGLVRQALRKHRKQMRKVDEMEKGEKRDYLIETTEERKNFLEGLVKKTAPWYEVETHYYGEETRSRRR